MLVFQTSDGLPFNDWQIRRRLDPAVDSCDAIAKEKKHKISMHVLRHSAASLMVGAGVSIFDVSKILGHSSVLVTMRYAHFAPEAGRVAIDALDRKLRPDVGPVGVAESLVPYVRSRNAAGQVPIMPTPLRVVRDSA